jgi:hypothetical protein
MSTRGRPLSDEEWQDHVRAIDGQISPAGRHVAELLWSIERFGDVDHLAEAAPIYIELGVALMNRDHRHALMEALSAMDGDTSK